MRIPDLGQAGWLGAGEGGERLCRGLSGRDYETGLCEPPSCLLSWRLDLNPLRRRFRCQGISEGKSAQSHLFKVSMVKTELNGS